MGHVDTNYHSWRLLEPRHAIPIELMTVQIDTSVARQARCDKTDLTPPNFALIFSATFAKYCTCPVYRISAFKTQRDLVTLTFCEHARNRAYTC